MQNGAEAPVQGTIELLPQKSQKPPPGFPWSTGGVCLWPRGMMDTAGHLAFSPPPHQEVSPSPVPPAQPLTWAWGCWFLGKAGRLWGSPSISIQYLLFKTCRDIARRGGAGASQ